MKPIKKEGNRSLVTIEFITLMVVMSFSIFVLLVANTTPPYKGTTLIGVVIFPVIAIIIAIYFFILKLKNAGKPGSR
jgi:hypothetical protein